MSFRFKKTQQKKHHILVVSKPRKFQDPVRCTANMRTQWPGLTSPYWSCNSEEFFGEYQPTKTPIIQGFFLKNTHRIHKYIIYIYYKIYVFTYIYLDLPSTSTIHVAHTTIHGSVMVYQWSNGFKLWRKWVDSFLKETRFLLVAIYPKNFHEYPRCSMYGVFTYI